jgi:type II secretory pathway pseudopilin PulG
MRKSIQISKCKPHDERSESCGYPCGYPRAARRAPRAPRGLSTVEFLLAMALVAGILAVLVLISNSLRQRSAHQRTVATLRALRQALGAYYARHQMYPVGSTHLVIDALLDDPDARRYIGPAQPTTNDAGHHIIADGFGHPVQYMPDTNPAAPTAGATTAGVSGASGGDFVSVGPDGRLGDIRSPHRDEVAAVSDNLYGRDLQEDAAP